jgi:hypothetical protein
MLLRCCEKLSDRKKRTADIAIKTAACPAYLQRAGIHRLFNEDVWDIGAPSARSANCVDNIGRGDNGEKFCRRFTAFLSKDTGDCISSRSLADRRRRGVDETRKRRRAFLSIMRF